MENYKRTCTCTVHIRTIIKKTRVYTYITCVCVYISIYQHIFGRGVSRINVPVAPGSMSGGSSRKRRWRVRLTRRRSAARHVITPRQCTYWGRGDTGLFCRYTGLFCGDVGLVCGDKVNGSFARARVASPQATHCGTSQALHQLEHNGDMSSACTRRTCWQTYV